MPRLDENARWARFLRMLDEWDELTQERVAQYLDLALSDPDVNVGGGAVIRLVAHPGVTDTVLDAIEPRLPATWKAARARLSERRVRLPLEQGLTDDMHVDAAIELGARNVQLWLLDNIHLSRGALERLQVEGVTRAIRNRAAQRVRVR